jgi:hypothetical protein
VDRVHLDAIAVDREVALVDVLDAVGADRRPREEEGALDRGHDSNPVRQRRPPRSYDAPAAPAARAAAMAAWAAATRAIGTRKGEQDT